MRYDPKRSMSILETVPCSRGSAEQRRGRAGRTSPGVCYRLYSQVTYHTMTPSQLPEILCNPIHLILLTLLRMRIDPCRFGWIESPGDEAIKSGISDLFYLGAIDSMGLRNITDFGTFCLRLQMDPMLLRVVWYGADMGMAETAVAIGAVLTVSNSFFRRSDDDRNAVIDKVCQ